MAVSLPSVPRVHQARPRSISWLAEVNFLARVEHGDALKLNLLAGRTLAACLTGHLCFVTCRKARQVGEVHEAVIGSGRLAENEVPKQRLLLLKNVIRGAAPRVFGTDISADAK